MCYDDMICSVNHLKGFEITQFKFSVVLHKCNVNANFNSAPFSSTSMACDANLWFIHFFAASQTPSIIRAAIGIQWLAHILIIPKEFGVSFSIFMLTFLQYRLGNVKLCFNVIYSIFHLTL